MNKPTANNEVRDSLDHGTTDTTATDLYKNKYKYKDKYKKKTKRKKANGI